MKFNRKDLNVLAYANGFTLWHYSTPGRINEVMRDNYFLAAKEDLGFSDLIIANCADGTALLHIRKDDDIGTSFAITGGNNGRKH